MFRIVMIAGLAVSMSIAMLGCVDGDKVAGGIPRIDPKKENDLVSPDTDVLVTITVKNQTKSEVSMHWLDDTSGDRVHYKDIPAGGEVAQEAFQGHYWIIMDKGGKAIGIYETPDEDGVIVIK